MKRPRHWRRNAGYYCQYLALRLVLGLLRLLPVDAASAIGGRIGRCLGPRLRRHGVARANMQRALPDLSAARIDAALADMWDNLGRTFAEYAHLDTFGRSLERADGRIEVIGREHLEAAAAAGRGMVVFSAHLANWELAVLLQTSAAIETALIYRRQNNPWIDRLLDRLRASRRTKLAPKGAAGARDMIAALRAGGAVGVLVDQKYNEGLAVPFFGHPAMTVTGPAELAIRRAAPLIPLRIERRGGARFRITVYPPLEIPPSGPGDAGKDDTSKGDTNKGGTNTGGTSTGGTNNGDAVLAALLGRMNATLEDWIRAAPGQWYWIHQRWPKNQ